MNARLPASALPLEPQALQSQVDAAWRESIVPELQRYIAVPAKSPMFDPDWAAHGLLERVLQNAADWVRAQQVPGLQLEIVRLNDAQGRPRTPVLFFELPASEGKDGTPAPASGQTVLMYGHLDKQPEFNGWRSDLGPWTPVIDDGKLYGRGGADDGYAIYAAITAIQALKAQGVAHPRIVGLIETCEESGSADLLPYVDALKARLGDVGLVICLDSGAGNYDQLWLTTSLRGMASGVLKVEILTEGIHSGDASGLVPSSFRIMRQVLDRLEDSGTGRLLPASFHCEVPAERLAQAQATAAILGDELFKRFPWAHHDCGGATVSALPTTTDPVEALLARTWRPTLSVTGADGFPDIANAGNVLRPVHRVQAQPAPAAAGRGRARRAAAQGPAGRQRALPGQGDVRGPELGHRLECALHHAVVRAGAAGRLAGALRRRLRHHRPGRHHPADEHAQPGLPHRADDGLRRARPAQQRARPQRIPAPGLRAAPDRLGGAGHRPHALTPRRPCPTPPRRPSPCATA